MRIQKTQTNCCKEHYYASKTAFKSNTLTKKLIKDIGSMPCGLIGQIEALKSNGEKAILNVIKSTYKDYEIYDFTDDYSRIIGKIEFRFNKNPWGKSNEKDHVFVSNLKNFSDPKTPYYKEGLEEYKQIGTKLLQIAQKRSFENNCNGNIELVAKNHKFVLEFYKKLGFQQPENITRYGNPYRLGLRADTTNLLSNKYGGLRIL